MGLRERRNELTTAYRVAADQKATMEAKQAAEIEAVKARYTSPLRELSEDIAEAEYELKRLKDIADIATMRKNII